MQDCSIRMFLCITVSSLMTTITASGTFLFALVPSFVRVVPSSSPLLLKDSPTCVGPRGFWCLFHPLSRLYASSWVLDIYFLLKGNLSHNFQSGIHIYLDQYSLSIAWQALSSHLPWCVYILHLEIRSLGSTPSRDRFCQRMDWHDHLCWAPGRRYWVS